MKLYLILSFIYYLEASIVSDIRFTTKNEKLENEDKKLIQTITVTNKFIDCLNNAKIIPKNIIDAIATKKTIKITKDYEDIVDLRYNNFITNQTINALNSCISKEKQAFIQSEKEEAEEKEEMEIVDNTSSPQNENECNITKLEELVYKNYPKKIKTKGQSVGPSNPGKTSEVENYSNIKTYVNNLISQSQETKDYKIYDIIFDTNCQTMFVLGISKEEYLRLKENDTFFEE